MQEINCAGLGGLQILIADAGKDGETHYDSLLNDLKIGGFKYATSHDEFSQLLGSNSPDAIVLDWKFPHHSYTPIGSDGIGCLAHLREIRHRNQPDFNQKPVFVTIDISAETRVAEAMICGASAVFHARPDAQNLKWHLMRALDSDPNLQLDKDVLVNLTLVRAIRKKINAGNLRFSSSSSFAAFAQGFQV